MRVAALYDIHGNLPALEAVLEELQRITVDQVIVGGDVLSGPMQGECLDRLRALPVPVHFLMGNSDREVIAARNGEENRMLPPSVLDILRWSAKQLTAEHVEWVASWPKVVRIETWSHERVLFCHATPRNDDEIFTSRTDEARLLSIFDAAQADLVVCGHTHMQFDRLIGTTRVVNAGSVGMPFGPFGADWLLLDDDIELRHTNYDQEEAKRRIADTGFSSSPEFDILNPPAAERMLLLYNRAELKS